MKSLGLLALLVSVNAFSSEVCEVRLGQDAIESYACTARKAGHLHKNRALERLKEKPPANLKLEIIKEMTEKEFDFKTVETSTAGQQTLIFVKWE
jgi:hypothetical protein